MVEFESSAKMIVNFALTGEKEPPISSEINMVYRVQDIDTLRKYHRYGWKALPSETINKGETQ